LPTSRYGAPVSQDFEFLQQASVISISEHSERLNPSFAVASKIGSHFLRPRSRLLPPPSLDLPVVSRQQYIRDFHTHEIDRSRVTGNFQQVRIGKGFLDGGLRIAKHSGQ
jgi:hypothetical protein